MSFDREIFPFTDYQLSRIPTSELLKTSTAGSPIHTTQQWDRSFREFSVTLPLQTESEVDTLYDFWYVHEYADDNIDSFLLEDPKDHHVSGTELGVADGSTTRFQTKRVYSFGNRTYKEPVRYIQSGINVFLDGSGTTNFTIDQNNGIINLSNIPASGTSVSATFDYYRKVTFADSSVPEQLETDLISTITFTVLEVN